MTTAINLVRRFRQLRALVIGDAMLDTYLEGTAARLCSEGPVPVVRKTAEQRIPGGAANTAANLRALDADVVFLGLVGSDIAGTLLRSALRERNVNDSWLLEDPTAQTLHKLRVLADGQYVVRFDEGTTFQETEGQQRLILMLEQVYPLCDLIIVSDYRYGVLSNALIERLRTLHTIQPKPLLIDSKALHRFRDLEATIVTPNLLEAQLLVGETEGPQALHSHSRGGGGEVVGGRPLRSPAVPHQQGEGDSPAVPHQQGEGDSPAVPHQQGEAGPLRSPAVPHQQEEVGPLWSPAVPHQQEEVGPLRSPAVPHQQEEGDSPAVPHQQEGGDVSGGPSPASLASSSSQNAESNLTQVEHLAQKLLSMLKTQHVAITLAEHGVFLVDRHGNRTHIQAHPVAHANDVGAGDSFASAMALALAAGGTPEEAARIGIDAASIAVTKQRTAVTHYQELLQRVSLREYTAFASPDRPVGDTDDYDAVTKLSSLLDIERLTGRRIVFTNGVFDILHAGHVQFLRQAKALGDMLVVGLNSDRSTRRLKGAGRPINNERDRMALVAALDTVDAVILFDEDTPTELIRALRPAIHVKGGDYADEALPEAEAVRECGGQIVILPLVGTMSTSSVIDRITELSSEPDSRDVIDRAQGGVGGQR